MVEEGSAGAALVRWLLGGAFLVAAFVVGGFAFSAVFGEDDSVGEVVRVVDGDTLIAMVAGEETTIRLLNVDTPETKHPNKEIQCLGPEASEFLAERLPAGTEIELEYDQERTDRYDRTLAGVYESESLINAEIAAAGLGVPVHFAPNDRFLDEVERASEEARRAGLGLFSAEIACTLPAQLTAQSAAVDSVPTSMEGDPTGALAEAATVVDGADALVEALTPDHLPTGTNAVLAAPLLEDWLEDLREEAADVRERAGRVHGDLETLKTEYDAEQERLRKEEEERKQREEEERKQREEEERQQREEEEREQREEEEREERRRQQSTPSASTPQTTPGKSAPKNPAPQKSSGSSSSGSGCVPYGPEISYSDDGGYTGKRYGMPGGKTFRKCR